jgi:hypothetical protein
MSNEIYLHTWKPARLPKKVPYLRKHSRRTCTNVLELYSCKTLAHTLPVAELEGTCVHVDCLLLYAPQHFLSCSIVKKLAHKFVESIKEANTLFGSWFELLIIFNSCDQGSYGRHMELASMVFVHGLLVQETPFYSCAFCWKVLGPLIGANLFLFSGIPGLKYLLYGCCL